MPLNFHEQKAEWLRKAFRVAFRKTTSRLFTNYFDNVRNLCKYQPAIKPIMNAINVSKVLQNGTSLIKPKHAMTTITMIAIVKYSLFLFVMSISFCKLLSKIVNLFTKTCS